MAKRERKPSSEPSIPGWVVTYGDMMSLLLTFFILIVSFSSISQKDFKEAMMSLQGAFGVLNKYDGLITLIPRPPKKPTKEREDAARELKRKMQVEGKEEVKVEFDKAGGIKIVLPNQLLFDSGSADLKPEASSVMETLGSLFSTLPDCFIEVRGHTDSRPLSSTGRFRDNYDLSYFRADSVVRGLTGGGAIPLERFEVIACGPGQPIATNDTEEGRGANRRVEIYVRPTSDSSKMSEIKEQLDQVVPSGGEPSSPGASP